MWGRDMKKSVIDFLSKASSDLALGDKIREINEKYPDKEENGAKLVALAKEYGFDLDASDFEEDNISELDEAELEGVAGGRIKEMSDLDGTIRKRSDCACFAGGGGSSDSYQKTCACVLAGAGEFTKKGKDAVKSHKIYAAEGSSSGAPVAMWCAVLGSSSFETQADY